MATQTLTSSQTAIQHALLEQTQAYIAQYTPTPRITSYATDDKGNVMGKLASQGRVFTFRLSNNKLIYKPFVPRTDSESEDEYKIRLDSLSSLYIQKFEPLIESSRTDAQNTDGQDYRSDAAKAFKPKTSVSVPTAKKKRGTKDNPVCGVTSYHCGVCISLGKNCIKNANTTALKERLSKINSLARMAHQSGVLPQVKTGIIGANVDPKSLMKKAQEQAREQFEGSKTSTNPNVQSNTNTENKSFAFDKKLSWGENRKALKNYLEKLGVSTGDEGVGSDSYWQDKVKKLERAANLAKKDPKSITQSEFDEMINALPIKHSVVTGMRDWQQNTLKDSSRVKALKSKYGENAGLTEIYKNEVYSKQRAIGEPSKSKIAIPDLTNNQTHQGTHTQIRRTGDLYEVRPANILSGEKFIGDKEHAEKVFKDAESGSAREASEKISKARYTAPASDSPIRKAITDHGAKKQTLESVDRLLDPKLLTADKDIQKAARSEVYTLYRNQRDANNGAYAKSLNDAINEFDGNVLRHREKTKDQQVISKVDPTQSDYIPLTSGKNLTPSQQKQSRTSQQVSLDRAKDDVRRASQAINKLDDSIKKIKSGKGVMSEADLKKVASLEKQKFEWVNKKAEHEGRLAGLSGKGEDLKPKIQGTGETESERRQFLLNTNTQSSAKPIEPKREIELADVKTPQDHIKYATQELNIAKASKDPERIQKWNDELQRAKKKHMSSLQSANNTHQPDLFFVNKGNPNQKSIFDSANFDAEYDESVERNILTNIGLMLSRAISGNQTSPNTVQLRKVKSDGANLSGIFTQYGEQFNFDITSKGVVISPIQVRQDRIAGVAYAKTKNVGTGRKCGKGYKCKGTCINKNNKCRVNWASKEGLAQFKSMQSELKSLTSPKFIEINGRQVAEQKSPESDIKALALAKHLSTARQFRKEYGEQHKEQTKKFYGKVNAEVEKRLKDASLNVNKIKSTLGELDPKDLAVDPKRFQYKITGEHTASGTVGSLQGVNKWDENLAGILQVWKDPADGKTYVVNGHNRLSKANELGADKVAVRYLDVPSAKEARTIGAMTNIAEGHGTALDAAKFFRDTNWTKEDLVKKGIPLKEKIATDGLAIASLEPNLFRQVIDGELPMERAAIIGGNGLSHEKQKSLMDLLSKRKAVNNSVLSELIDTVKHSGQKQEEQFDLFGNSTATVDLAVHRASLQSHIKQKLASEKKLFGTVSKSKSAKDLERGGNVIDANKSGEIASQADTALKIFDTIKHHVGSVSDALNSAAERLADAKNKAEKEKINRETYETVLKAIQHENDKLKPKRDSILEGGEGSDLVQCSNSSNSRQQATGEQTKRTDTVFSDQDQILTYVTDNSGNMMGILQLGGVKYRFLKPIFGIVTLTPVGETNLSYLFDQAPDLTLPQGTLLDQVMPKPMFNGDSISKKRQLLRRPSPALP